MTTSAACWGARCREHDLTNESRLMDTLTPTSAVAVPPAIPDRSPGVWKFWGTTLWGLFIFAAMFLGQVTVIGYFVLRQGMSFDVAEAIRVVGSGLTISLSVILGLPAVQRGYRLPTIWRCAGPHGAISSSASRRWSSSSAAGTCCRGRSGAR
jgi:hypothetical protein